MVTEPTNIRADVVTVILQHYGKILILKRSGKVKTMKFMWAGISGYIEKETPLERALNEIKEETGLTKASVKLALAGQPIEVVEPGKPGLTWIVHPFLFDTSTILIRLDWEHEEYKWIRPKDLDKYRTVPRLKDVVNELIQRSKLGK
jgi:8-oxo-dGTP pyrophosphatase MutT (NUDIX family)